jgi:hypothetical protein
LLKARSRSQQQELDQEKEEVKDLADTVDAEKAELAMQEKKLADHLAKEEKLVKLAASNLSASEKEKLVVEINEAKTITETLAKSVSESKDEVLSKEKELEVVNKAVHELEEQVKKSEIKVELLVKESEEKDALIEELEQKAEEATLIVKEVEREKAEVEREEAELKRQLEEAKTQAAEAKHQEATETVVKLQEQISLMKIKKDKSVKRFANAIKKKKEVEEEKREVKEHSAIEHVMVDDGLKKELENEITVLREKLEQERKDRLDEEARQQDMHGRSLAQVRELEGRLEEMKLERDRVGVEGDMKTKLAKLTAEHERTLGQISATMKDKSDMLKYKEEDIKMAQETIKDLKIKVLQAGKEVKQIKKSVVEKNEALEVERERREKEGKELDEKIAALGDGDSAEKKKIMALVKDSKKLLDGKEQELSIAKESVKELEHLIDDYEGAIGKLNDHVVEQDARFEQSVVDGERLLLAERQRADIIWNQLLVLKNGGQLDEAVMEKFGLGGGAAGEWDEERREEEEAVLRIHKASEGAKRELEEERQEIAQIKSGLAKEREHANEVIAQEERVHKRVAMKEREVREEREEVKKVLDERGEGGEEGEEGEDDEDSDADLDEDFDFGDIEELMDYDDENLREVCTQAAKVGLRLEKLEHFMDRLLEKGRKPELYLEEGKETLLQVQEGMIEELCKFGVDPCAALRHELDRTFLKHKTMNQWKNAMGLKGGGGDDEEREEHIM